MNKRYPTYKVRKQVNPKQYTDIDKLSLINFLNCYQQVIDVRDIGINNPKILIVGIGDNILHSILKKYYSSVDTIDILDELKPTIVGSIHQLSLLTKKKYDIIIASHVLEHLPFDLFETCLKEIKKHSRYSIIYLPRAGLTFQLHAKVIPIIDNKVNIFIPVFKFKQYSFNGEHYWEIDTKEYLLPKISQIVAKHFNILKSYHNQLWTYSYNFVLKTK